MNEKHKLNILFISPLGDEKSGGIAKWTSNILNYYKAASDDSLKITHCFNSVSLGAFDGDSLFVRVRKGISNYLPLYRKVKNYIAKDNIDVLHLCTSASISLIKDILILSYARRYGIKTVTHFHFGRIPSILTNKKWEYYLLRKVINLSNKVVVIDKKSYTALKNLNFSHVDYLPNPLSLDTQELIEKNKKNICKVTNKIVFVGQLLETKGVKELVKATNKLSNVQVHLIGHAPHAQLVEDLKALAGNNWNQWLHIDGPLSFDKVVKEMLSASLFVLPTYTEGFPNVIIESMACACPIITTPVGAIPEMLDIYSSSPCGVCVGVKNVEQLRRAIEDLLKDRELASSLGHRAKDRVYQYYSVNTIWKQLSSIWQSV